MHRGMKISDHVLGHSQIDWVCVKTMDCPNDETENQMIRSYFRPTREPSGNDYGFVEPVVILRTRRRVLFYQQSGETF